jgi:hypothetical protein
MPEAAIDRLRRQLYLHGVVHGKDVLPKKVIDFLKASF